MLEVKKWKIHSLGLMLVAVLVLVDDAKAQTKLVEQAGFPSPDLSNVLNMIAEQAGFFK
jgi:hypothetical protein